jgi:tRNA-dihydrouridine synthase
MEIRKHFTHYLHGFEGVKEYRKRLAMTQNLAETEAILKELSHLDVVITDTHEPLYIVE